MLRSSLELFVWLQASARPLKQNLLWKPRRLMPLPPRPNPRVHRNRNKRVQKFLIVRVRFGVWLRQCITKRRVSPVAAKRQLPKWLRIGWLQGHIQTRSAVLCINAVRGFANSHGPAPAGARQAVFNGNVPMKSQNVLLTAGDPVLPQVQPISTRILCRHLGHACIVGSQRLVGTFSIDPTSDRPKSN
jgi:hypothetical protein